MPIADNISLGGKFINAKELDGEGLILKLKEQARLVKANMYGFPPGHKYEGQTVRYTFEQHGEERCHDSTAVRLQRALNGCGAEIGDWVKLRRDEKGKDTQYFAEKVEKPADWDEQQSNMVEPPPSDTNKEIDVENIQM